MENFNQILKNYFAGQGLTQNDVAERLQVSRTVATNYLNGNKTFVNSELFLKHLRTAEYFSITLPVYGVGNTTFYFTTGGYPLDW